VSVLDPKRGRLSRRMATIQDVARLAGVSATTVSFVLNGVNAHGIPPATQQRVKAAASKLRYRPNATARLLRTSKSHTIGFITDEVASTPYAVDVTRGAQDAAWAAGKVLTIVNTGKDAKLMESAVTELLERRVEGVIYAAIYHQPVRLPELFLEVPCVLVNCYDEDRRWASVVPDERGGGRTATEALIHQGHRRIGFMNLSLQIVASAGRLQGYRQALADHGIEYDENLVSYHSREQRHSQYGYERAMELASFADPVTAIFCGNDRVAMGAYDALKERGLRIPEDVAIVGFDNMVLIAANLRPPLSTVALPHYEMGQWALGQLIKQAEHGGLEAVQQTLTCRFVERAST
jgi:LacI family transcriptional regulator